MLEDRDEKFNIFSALHKDHDERRLHSRFISVLLQPKGRHGNSIRFLNSFISQIDDLKNFIASEETSVFPKEKEKKENNNIDILVINKKQKQCLIIENKINAGDSNSSSGGQLERYIEHALLKENIPKEKIYVIYLTLDGHEPTPESIGKFKNFKNLFIYSYEDLILPWLDECLKDVVAQPFLRESLIQYKKLIQKMTGNSSSIEERIAYKKLIGSSDENMKSAKKLMENFKHIKWHSVTEFWENLQAAIISEKEYELIKPYDKDKLSNSKKNHCVAEITHYEKYRKGQKNKQKCFIHFKTQEGILMSVGFSANYDHFYFGAPKEGNEQNANILSELVVDYDDYESTNWMFISKIFKTDIKFNNFNKQDTFNLINSDCNKQIVKESFMEIKELTDRITKKSQ